MIDDQTNLNSVNWNQNSDGCFTGVDFKRQEHSKTQGDVERFSPKECPYCLEKAGFIPDDFQFCHLCGVELPSTKKIMEHERWPSIELNVSLEKLLPKANESSRDALLASPQNFKLPSGTTPVFCVVSNGNRLYALEPETGVFRVYSEITSKWCEYCTALKFDSEEKSPKLLTRGAWIIYTTDEHVVLVDTSGPEAIISITTTNNAWQPFGLPGFLSDTCLAVPALNENKKLGVAFLDLTLENANSKDAFENNWTFIPTPVTDERPLNLQAPFLLLLKEHSLHIWVSSDLVLIVDDEKQQQVKHWIEGFSPYLTGGVFLDNSDKFWVLGVNSGSSWQFERVSLNKVSKPFPYTFFCANKLRFSGREEYAGSVEPDSAERFPHSFRDKYFLVPMSSTTDKDGLVLAVEPHDRKSELKTLSDDPNEFVGQLWLYLRGKFIELEKNISIKSDVWPQSFVYRDSLIVHDVINNLLWCWHKKSKDFKADTD